MECESREESLCFHLSRNVSCPGVRWFSSNFPLHLVLQSAEEGTSILKIQNQCFIILPIWSQVVDKKQPHAEGPNNASQIRS